MGSRHQITISKRSPRDFKKKRSRGEAEWSVFQPEVKGRNHDLLSGSSEITFSFFTHEIEVFYPQTHLCAGRKNPLVRGSKTSLFVPAEKTRWWYRFRFWNLLYSLKDLFSNFQIQFYKPKSIPPAFFGSFLSLPLVSGQKKIFSSRRKTGLKRRYFISKIEHEIPRFRTWRTKRPFFAPKIENDCFETTTKKVLLFPLTEGFENKRSRGVSRGRVFFIPRWRE